MDNPQGAVDVPLSLFGGVTLELAPPDIPEGLSPDCQDVVFLPGSVASRPGLHRLFATPLGSPHNRVTYEKSYIAPDGTTQNLFLLHTGELFVESPAGVGTVTQIAKISKNATSQHDVIATSVTFQGREYFAFSDGEHGIDNPMQWDGTNLERVTQDGPGATCICLDSASAGQVTVGLHNFVVMFQTTNGYITAPCPNSNFVAAGNKKISVSQIPIGPNNTQARIIAFTGAGGNNYFYIPVTPMFAGQAVGTSTVIPDNTTTTATFDFSDTTLFNSIAIDIPGNNLFENLTLPQSLNVFAYSQRLAYMGMDNKVINFNNMGFDGGYYLGSFVTPLGWNPDVAGATLINLGFGGFIVHFASSGASPSAQLSQTAYQDSFFVPIIQSSTKYKAKIKARAQGAFLGSTGFFVVAVHSASFGGNLLVGGLNLAGMGTSGDWRTWEFTLGTTTAAAIPSDARLQLYLSGVPAGKGVEVDTVDIIYEETPYIDNRILASYIGEPEQFDQLTGYFGPATDPSPIRCCSILKDFLRIKTRDGIHTTTDNGTTEPNGWTISTFSRTVGALSLRSGDPGMFGSGDTAEDWDVTASRGGLYIDFGGDLYKVSQEIQDLWDTINWAWAFNIWLKNDPMTRRIYVGLPTGTATVPNIIAVMDYRELDAAAQIANAAPVHTSYSGKMVSSDLTRKWTPWNVAASSGNILVGPQNIHRMTFGGSQNAYYLDPAKLTDDDYGIIQAYYTTYAFLNHEAEVALGTGVHRKLYRYLTIFASGVGNLIITPLVDSIANSWPPTPAYQLVTAPTFDIEWGLNVTGERCFFKISVQPIQTRITYIVPPDAMVVENAYQFTVGQTVSVVSFLGNTPLGSAVIASIDEIAGLITFTTPYPGGTVNGYYVISQAWPDNSFEVNKMVASIQAEPHAPVRGAW